MTATLSTAVRPLRDIVEIACRAPSVHNTQPWLWRLAPDRIELHADRRRQLPIADPTGRNLVISCGAALHQAGVAAAATGYPASIERLPDPGDPDHLATLRFARPAEPPGGRAPRAVADLRALEARCTDRRRFTSWPIPEEKLRALAASTTAAGSGEAQAVAVIDPSERLRVERLVIEAMTREAADEQYAAEQRAWIDRSDSDGIPAATLAAASETFRYTHPSRFDAPVHGDADPLHGTDGLLIVCSSNDDLEGWLRAGEALCMLWLRATIEGLSVVPLSQVIELADTRSALHHDVLGGLVAPQILVRIGWQEISRRQLPRTPRRPVAEVLMT